MSSNRISTYSEFPGTLDYFDLGIRNTFNIQILLIFILTMIPAIVSAADLQVRVYDRSGKVPLRGASVCLGTPANLMQFGSGLTDREGDVVFQDPPQAPLVVTASKSGYKSEQESLVISNMERTLAISMAHGGGGPDCTPAGTVAARDSGGLRIGWLRINKGAAKTPNRQVLLSNAVSGHATHYRASEQADFAGAAWEPYTQEPSFQLSPGNGSKRVFFQVRRYSEINGADIQSYSSVAQDSITLQLP